MKPIASFEGRVLSLLPMFHFLHKKSVLLLAWVFCFTVLNSLPAIAGKCGSKQAECLEADFGEPNNNRVNRIELPRFGAPLEREQETKRVLLDLSIPTALISLIGEYLAIPAVRIVSNERGLAITVGDSLFVTDEEEKSEKGERTDQANPSFPPFPALSEVQLPPDSTDEQASPVKISELAATSTCMFILTGKGGVFGWGDDYFGELGPSNPMGKQVPSHPVWIPIPSQGKAEEKSEEKSEENTAEKVTLLATHLKRGCAVIAVTASKKTFIWGCHQGYVNWFCSTPTAIEPLAGKEILFVDATALRMFCLATADAVYAWGKSRGKDLGLRLNIEPDHYSPVMSYEIKAPTGVKIQNLKVLDNPNRDISVTLLILGDNGRVYAWGCGSNGLLGRKGSEFFVWNSFFQPVSIPESERITDLQVDGLEENVLWAKPRAFALTQSGKVYIWGHSLQWVKNPDTIMDTHKRDDGSNARVNLIDPVPIQVRLLGDEKITCIAPGLETLFVAGSSGSLYLFHKSGMHSLWNSPLGADSIQSLRVTKQHHSGALYLLILLNDGSLFIKKQVEGQNIRQGLSEAERVRPFFHNSGEGVGYRIKSSIQTRTEF